MTPERWQQIDRLFHAALACEPSDRASFLRNACVGDDPLRAEVESLISSHESQQSFIETPPGDIAAEMLGAQKSTFERGQQIANYKIVRRLGSGGMGEVYLANDTRLNRRIAIKLLPTEFNGNPNRVRRFEQEVRAVSSLNHPNILTIHEVGEIDGCHYIVNEFIDGQTLRQRLREPLKIKGAIEIAIQVASGLVAAHRRNIIHRDIKPENIMIRKDDGLAKVLDFGLAKMTVEPAMSREFYPDTEEPTQVKTAPGVVMGTVDYMSPEQARGKAVDARTDIWSLGVVLYESLTGRVPFAGETSSHVIVSIIEAPPEPPSRFVEIPAELERIVLKCLSKPKIERYQNASDLVLDLTALLQELDVEARVNGATDQRGKEPLRRSYSASTFVEAEARTSAGGEHLPSQNKTVRIDGRPKTFGTWMRRPIAKLLVAGLVLATLMGFYVWKSAKTNSNAPELIVKSIAVLPLENLSGDAEQQYIADGLTEALINELAKISALRVIARTSAMKYKHSSKSISEIARELNVDAVVEGSVLQSNQRVRVTTQLINGRTDTNIWAENYERDLRDVLALQSDIARGVAREIHIKLTPQEQQRLTTTRSVNPQAHEAYLNGLYYLNQGIESQTKSDVERLHKRSNEYFELAIKLDPADSLAYSGLASSYSWLASSYFPEFYPKAKEAALKALELDDNNAEAHGALAYTIWRHEWNFAEAEREFKRAVELAPNSHNWGYAQFLSTQGRHDEALQRFRLAQDHDPLIVYLRVSFGFAYLDARQYDQAIAQYKTVLELDSKQAAAHSGLCAAYILKGMHNEGIAECQRATDQSDELGPRVGLAWAYAIVGNRSEAIKIVDELKNSLKITDSRVSLAAVYSALGDKDRAMAQLERAYAERAEREPGELLWLKVDQRFDNLRSDSRFTDLLRRIGFTQ